eukprot:Nk52_evm25s1129 gene=Nk52_evmTU25s1129
MQCSQRSTVRNKATITTGEWAKGHNDIICNSVREKKLANAVRETGIEIQNYTHKDLKEQKEHSDEKIEQRIKEVNAWKGALDVQIQETKNEMNEVSSLLDFLTKRQELFQSPKSVFNECIKLREGKVSERVYDHPEENLYTSVDVSCQALLVVGEFLKELAENFRKLKASLYTLEHDIRDKVTALKYEETARNMGQHGVTPFITLVASKKWVNPVKWVEFTSLNIEEASSVVNNSVSLRAKQTEQVEQCLALLLKRSAIVSGALSSRVEEIQAVKKELEAKAAVTEEEIRITETTIADLENSIAEKLDPIRIATARLDTRSQRPNMELVKDPATFAIEYEITVIKKAIQLLRNNIKDANSALMRLRRTKVAIADDLEKVEKSISIDEACLEIVNNLEKVLSS